MQPVILCMAVLLSGLAADPPQLPPAVTPSSAPAVTPSSAPADSAPPAPPPFVPIAQDSSLVFQLEASSRLYPEWKEEHAVHLQQRFPLGDSPNSAVIQKFFADFRIVDGQATNVGRALNNPAIRMLVYKGDAPVDSSWAFLNFPPHFSPRSFYTFQLKKIEGYTAGP